MNSIKKQARTAGWLYLSLALTAPFSLLYVPSALIVSGDAAATAARIRASEMLFRFGIVGKVLTATLFAIVVLALYRLLKRVNQTHAVLMVTLAMISVPLAFLYVINDIAALVLFKGAGFLSGFDQSQLEALGYLSLRLHSQGTVVAELFWGLWLLPFGLLVFRSGFLPRLLGVLLIINGFAYVAESLTGLLLPQYAAMVSRIAFPALFGEVAITLWLVIVGAKPHASDAAAPSSAA
ncbi:MAG: hypothetical protein A2W00_14410 [Candidatus Eisenbacteria bacterium RBG_16_71_46]|nr:MAG: hypothetical protein A2W00_14410 [Candidatus Eisenbacteria bacterium RBG_16_71_46]OGF23665.1 MAG: hypothetical protein A2V63_00900 [Candidatus Eisenbacteria bacterium RBG_19FT_COMBO_70_11]